MIIRARRLVTAGALAVAAVAAPIAISMSSAPAKSVDAAPCLATVTTNGSDPVCVGYSNGNGINLGTPFGVYGPNNPNYAGGGFGTGPLLPGRTWTRPIA